MNLGLAYNKGRVALTPADQLVVPILCAPRSGGALVARLLGQLGVELGWPLSPVGKDNPRGAWEHSFFRTVNRQFLAGFGCDEDGLESPEKLAVFAHRMGLVDLAIKDQDDLQSKLSSYFMQPVWAFKDTRTALTWPLWSRLLSDFGYRKVQPIVVVRHPDACWASMTKWAEASEPAMRLGMSPEDFVHSMWWGTHQAILSSDLEESATLLVSLEDLLSPRTAPVEIARLAEHIGGASLEKQSKALSSIEFCAQPYFELPSDPQLAELYTGLTALVKAQHDAFVEARPPLPSLTLVNTIERTPRQQTPYCIYQVTPAGYPHSAAFDEIALGLHHAFESLGLQAPIVRHVDDITGTPIVVGANLIGGFVDTLEIADVLPEDSIIYNLEQIDPTSAWMTDRYLGLLNRFRVWDYSPANAQRLLQMGIEIEGVCGIGYVPELERIEQGVFEDIDVLFYGGMNPRRAAILDALKARGLNVVVAANCFGEARDQLVARSKIVLNIHFYEAKVLEMVRISYLLANGQCVVSEVGVDRDEETFFQEGIAFASYEGLVDRCVELVAQPEQRRRISRNAKSIFSRLHQAQFLAERLQ